MVRGADGAEKELVLLRVGGQIGYVCNEQRLREAAGDPDADIEVGVLMSAIRRLGAAN